MLKLDPNQKSYTMKMEELFTTIQNIVSHPHTVITSHDKQRTAKIFLALQDYVSNYTFIEQDGSPRIDPDFALDFDTYVESIFDEKELDEIRKMN